MVSDISYNSLPHRSVGFGQKNYRQLFLKNTFTLDASWWYRDLKKEDVENLKAQFQEIWKTRPIPSMLIVGVGNLKEPYSYLTIMSEMRNHQPLEKYLDLNCVDIKPKITERDIEKFSHIDKIDYRKSKAVLQEHFPESSFRYVKAINEHFVNLDIVDDFKKVLKSNKKTFWSRDVADFAEEEVRKGESGKKYDIIACNKVFMYLDDWTEQEKTAKNLVKMLNKGGILINMSGDIPRLVNSQGNIVLEAAENGRKGIYKKVGTNNSLPL